MHVISVNDINEALPRGLAHLRDSGVWQDSRAGRVLVAPTPVTTVYFNPRRRVLFDPVRDANPFFHLFEALWILAGRRDVRSLATFNKRMAEYSDNGVTFHAPYGYRLRSTFALDQIETATAMLDRDLGSRQAVLLIWHPVLDLGAASKDIPCNDMVFLRLVEDKDLIKPYTRRLDITVCNRSNDVIWGAYGANIVQFSVLQEYLAAKLGAAVGTYYQVSNNYHVYEANPYWKAWSAKHEFAGGYAPDYDSPYACLNGTDITPIVGPEDVATFESDLRLFFNDVDTGAPISARMGTHLGDYKHPFFRSVVYRMLRLHATRDVSEFTEEDMICDWFLAGVQWVMRRMGKIGGAA